MKNSFSFSLIVLTIILYSCANSNKGSNSNSKETQKARIDTLYNDSIQGMFFGIPFGANHEVVVKKLREQGFAFNQYNSTETFLRFKPLNHSTFSFGNMEWEFLDIGLANNRFNYIRFMSKNDDKASAIHNFNNVLTSVSEKYQMTEGTPRDSTEYKLYVGYSKTSKMLWISCFRYESKVFVSLEYDDNEFSKVSSEL
jgi:hypothetical protein